MRKGALLRSRVALLGAVVVALPFVAGACNKGDAPPPASPASPSAASSAGAPPAAVASGPLAQPGPAALPCTTDAMCLAHRCNVAAGKCAFPCETDADCTPGNFCFKGAIAACLPKTAGAP